MKLYFAGIYTSLEGINYSDNFLTSYIEFKTHKNIQEKLLENNPEEHHTDTNVIAVWRHFKIGR